jgi:hypothetical protein
MEASSDRGGRCDGNREDDTARAAAAPELANHQHVDGHVEDACDLRRLRDPATRPDHDRAQQLKLAGKAR